MFRINIKIYIVEILRGKLSSLPSMASDTKNDI